MPESHRPPSGDDVRGRPRLDFVLLGFGTGALLVLIGRMLRVYGPRYRRRQLKPTVPFSTFAAALVWRRWCRAGGLVSSIAGAFLLLLTFLLLLANVADNMGMVVVGFSLLSILIGGAIWAALFVHPEWRTAERRSRPSIRELRDVAITSDSYDAAIAAWPDSPSGNPNHVNGPRRKQTAGESSDLQSAAAASWPSPEHHETEESKSATDRFTPVAR